MRERNKNKIKNMKTFTNSLALAAILSVSSNALDISQALPNVGDCYANNRRVKIPCEFAPWRFSLHCGVEFSMAHTRSNAAMSLDCNAREVIIKTND